MKVREISQKVGPPLLLARGNQSQTHTQSLKYTQTIRHGIGPSSIT